MSFLDYVRTQVKKADSVERVGEISAVSKHAHKNGYIDTPSLEIIKRDIRVKVDNMDIPIRNYNEVNSLFDE